EVADLLDADVAPLLLPRHHVEIRMRPGREADALRARTAGVAADHPFTEETCRERPRERVLPDPRRTGEEHRARDTGLVRHAREPRDRPRVPHHPGEGHATAARRRSASATTRARTSSTSRSVSTIRKRSGSAAASERKPARTRSWNATASRSKRSPGR